MAVLVHINIQKHFIVLARRSDGILLFDDAAVLPATSMQHEWAYGLLYCAENSPATCVSGVFNLGNTCHLNAAIQMLKSSTAM